jgi:hypothetical protein
MFDVLPTQITRLRGSGDAAACVDAAVGWGRVCAAAEDMSLWAVDGEDDVVAQIGLAFGVSARWAMGNLETGATIMSTLVERTILVTDPLALARIDADCPTYTSDRHHHQHHTHRAHLHQHPHQQHVLPERRHHLSTRPTGQPPHTRRA